MSFYQIRSIAYETNKILGDVSAGMGGGVASGFRSGLYSGAKGLGDVNAAAKGNFSGRIRARGFGAGAAAGQGGIENLPTPLKRAINRQAGQNLQKIRSHGLYGKKTKNKNVKINYKNIDVVLNGVVWMELNEFYFHRDVFIQTLNSPGMQKIIFKNTKKIINYIKRHAPKDTGRYRNSWMQYYTVNPKTNRPEGYVISDDWFKGKFLEYGTVKMGARPTVRNAMLVLKGQSILPSEFRGITEAGKRKERKRRAIRRQNQRLAKDTKAMKYANRPKNKTETRRRKMKYVRPSRGKVKPYVYTDKRNQKAPQPPSNIW